MLSRESHLLWSDVQIQATPVDRTTRRSSRVKIFADRISDTGTAGMMNRRILVVDDDLMNLDMISQRLELRGYCVIRAVDGVQGFALAGAAARPDSDGCQHAGDGWI